MSKLQFMDSTITRFFKSHEKCGALFTDQLYFKVKNFRDNPSFNRNMELKKLNSSHPEVILEGPFRRYDCRVRVLTSMCPIQS